ncbi:MAG: AraC family transcriptional regulator [Pseudoxanthomonas sp.]
MPRKQQEPPLPSPRLPVSSRTPIAIQLHRLRATDVFDACRHAPDRLHLLHVAGRGVQIDLPGDWTCAWLALAGEFEMRSLHCEWPLHRSEAMLWNDGALCAFTRTPSLGLCLAAPAATWNQAMQPGRRMHGGTLPWHEPCPADLKRAFVRSARLARAGGMMLPATPVALCVALDEFMAPARELLEKCSGRTMKHHQQTLQRLLRVRHVIRHGAELRPDLASLARMANYSPYHLIRVYRSVFGETPFEYAARLREERAWRMVNDTILPICEITEMLGFESQSAFCRAFKNAFGTTASEVRRSAGELNARAA